MRVREKEPKLASFAGKPGINASVSTGDTAPVTSSKLPVWRGAAGSSHHLWNLLSTGELQASRHISTSWEPKRYKKALNGMLQSKKSPLYSHLGWCRGLCVPMACDSASIFWGHSITPIASRNGAFCILGWISFCHSSWHTGWIQECVTQRKERQLWTYKSQRYDFGTIY